MAGGSGRLKRKRDTFLPLLEHAIAYLPEFRLIIPSLFHEFFKRRPARACFLQLQLQPQRRREYW
jgi:hypothetical protein